MGLHLVTGGAGFIGSHLTEALLSRGEDVRVVDDFSTGRETNLEFGGGSKGWGRLEVVRGDISDPETARRCVEGVSHVYHQAALGSVPRSVAEPASTHRANATGTLLVLIAARDAGADRFIYASSSSVYGDTPTLPKVETMPTAPLSPYAISKLSGEMYAGAFQRLFGFPTIGLRYFNVFGPRQDPDSQYAAVIPRFISAALSGKAPVIYGDGKQTRDFTYVSNAVEANLRAATCGPGAFGKAFNVACGRQVSLLDLVACIAAETGARIVPDHAEPRAGDVRHSLADIGAAERDLGYRPGVGLEEGLKRTVAWHRATGS